jgi:uncharacterized protein
MPVDHIRYDILAREALRGVVRTVLEDAAKRGLPGEHHFYITFDTRADGVMLSQRLRAQFPAEMTIVLQHQFWDLAVTPDAFEVGLAFGGVPERLGVPFAAINGFFDPSVQFGLQFEPAPQEAGGTSVAGVEPEDASVKRPPAEHKRTPSALAAVPVPANPASGSRPEDGPEKPAGGGDVVRLDRFRKK